MKIFRRSIVEGVVLLSCGLIGIVDGLRLIYFKNRASVEDFTGPGRYLLVVAVLMAIVGAAFTFAWRNGDGASRMAGPENAGQNRKAAAIVAVVGLYIFLIDVVGYLWSTPIFFVLILRVVGMPFGPRTVAVGISMAVGFYLLFVRLFGMSFPRGWIFA